MFVGALAYADDIVLLAPTARAMPLMFGICDHYALEYSILFNAKKFKYISFGSRYGYSSPNKKLSAFFIGGSVVDYVGSWPHLCHIISNTGDDRLDIINRRSSLCTQINNVLCYFKSTSIIVKIKLLMSNCNSYTERKYGNCVINQLTMCVCVCVTWQCLFNIKFSVK